MPTYTYKCFHCDISVEVVKPMKEFDRVEQCGACSRIMLRDLQADLPHATADRYDKPIVSDALAMNPEQIPEHRRQFPDIKVLDDGRPVFDKYSSHNSYLEKCGFVKMPKKRKARGKKVNTKKEPTPSS